MGASIDGADGVGKAWAEGRGAREGGVWKRDGVREGVREVLHEVSVRLVWGWR